MKNKRGSTSELLMDNIVAVILVILVVSLAGLVIYKQKDNVVRWEEYYAAELSRLINMAEPGETVELDVQKATEIAFGKGVPIDGIFEFDNEKNKIYVKLSTSGRSSYFFFNEVDVFYDGILSGHKSGINKLQLRIEKAGNA